MFRLNGSHIGSIIFKEKVTNVVQFPELRSNLSTPNGMFEPFIANRAIFCFGVKP